MRRVALVLCAVLASLCVSGLSAMAASGDTAETARKAKRTKPRVTVKRVAPNGVVTVRLRAPRGARVTVRATGSSFDRPRFRMIKPRKILMRAKPRVLRLRPTTAGKAEAGNCLPLKVAVTARSRGRNGKASRKAARRSGCRPAPVDLSRSAECEFIAQPKEGMCMLPFPSDFYTVKDDKSPTGKRVRFTEGAMPRNRAGIPIDPEPFGDSDGFSQGQGIALKIPGIENAAAVTANRLVPINHIGEYARKDQRVLVIDAETGERWPIWANIDSNAGLSRDRLLEIKPARNFLPGKRYIVALRNLTDEGGQPLTAPDAFRFYRDGFASGKKPVEARRAHFEGVFRSLRKAKVKRSELYLAWDFTVASDENNYRRVLSMRDRAFAELGDTDLADNRIEPGSSAPDFRIDSVTEYSPAQNARVARYIKGSFTVPCFLKASESFPGPDCGPGSVMDLDQDRLPKRHGEWEANLECIVPQAAVQTGAKMRPLVFGHGLFGRADGVGGSVNPDLAQGHRMLICATDEIGMSGNDPGAVIQALMDLSSFKVVPDRLAQAIVNELYLARLMYHPQGLGTDPAFRKDGSSVIDEEAVYYMGASQGGILGGALTAVSPDFTRASFLVGAMNYSNLLPRSVDFDLYSGFLYPAYRDEMARPLLFGLMQMLWDRSEPNGYAHRMTDNPPPNTPPHEVTLQIALGDHEVSNFAAEVEARTVGMSTNQRPVDPGRWPDYDILWDVPRIKPSEYPYRRSNIIYFDGGPERPDPANPSRTIGNPTPPFENLPPRDGQNPHGAPGGASKAVQMTSDFLKPNGGIEDICAPKSCYSDIWTGLP